MWILVGDTKVGSTRGTRSTQILTCESGASENMEVAIFMNLMDGALE